MLRVISPQREADRVTMMRPSSMGSRAILTAWPFWGAGMVLSVAKDWALATRAVSTKYSTSQQGGGCNMRSAREFTVM